MKALATQAIKDSETHDYAFGATHYEHTKIYSTPKWAKNMKIVKIIYPNCKDEITLWNPK